MNVMKIASYRGPPITTSKITSQIHDLARCSARSGDPPGSEGAKRWQQQTDQVCCYVKLPLLFLFVLEATWEGPDSLHGFRKQIRHIIWED